LRLTKRLSKHVLFSTCLLLVLVGGAAALIVAQPTILVQVNVTIIQSGNVALFDVVVNGIPFCIVATPTMGPVSPKTLPKTTPQQPIATPLVGTEYFGTCSAYPSLGSPVGPFTGTITLDFPQSVPGPFTVMLDFTVGPGGVMNFHSESKFTGIVGDQTTCILQNVASPFAFVTGTGFSGTVYLQLLEVLQGGVCSFSVTSTTVFIGLPTFVFAPAAVGGTVIPVSTTALLAPWLEWLGVIGLAVSMAAFVAMRRRRQ
jgi:hypothetical protein